MSGSTSSVSNRPGKAAARPGTATPQRSPSGEAISVLVLAGERAERLDAFYEEYAPHLRAAGYDAEFIFALERWNAALAEPLRKLADAGSPIRVVEVRHGTGEAALLKAALREASAATLIMMPAYYRVEGQALPELVRQVAEGADFVVARRWPRRDSLINRLQGRAFHWLLRGAVGGQVDDVACGVRATRREVLDGLPLYGDFVRFLPTLAQHEGFTIEQVDAPQHERDRETRIYRPGVYWRRLIDLLGLLFLHRFTYKPLRFFGLIGSGFCFSGFVILLVIFIQRLGGQGIANRPILLLGVLLVTLGVQAIALGLIGEIIVHLNVPGRQTYRVVDRDSESES